MSLEEMKILICDDSLLFRRAIKDCVFDLGCKNIYEACDGEAAVEMYKEYNPDLVFMDIVMPKKDGIDAAAEIIGYDHSAKIAMASSMGTQAFLKEALKIGAFDFLQKPIDPEQVKKLVLNIAKEV